jgi:hypothetical protein
VSDVDDVRDGGVSRRTMLKRSALVGGSLVWMTPAVQSISATAFAGTTTGSPKPSVGVGPSNVTMLVLCDGKYYSAKIDSDERRFICGKEAQPPNAPEKRTSDGESARQAWFARLAKIPASPEKTPQCPTGVAPGTYGPGVPSCFVVSAPCTVVDWIVFDGALSVPSDTRKYRFKGESFPDGWEQPGSLAQGTLCFSKQS